MHFAGLQTDMEEAKTQENKKLQQQLQELQLQSKETKDILRREQENAKTALEKAALVPEIQVDTTHVDKLTAENENLKVNVILIVSSFIFTAVVSLCFSVCPLWWSHGNLQNHSP
jgi:hypothetical protein